MTRDLDLIREILFEVEKKDSPKAAGLEINGYSDLEISYHISLLADAGYIEAIDFSSKGGFSYQAKYLTWEGHEFLDAVRKDSIWKKAKTLISEKTSSLPFHILQRLLSDYLKAEIGLAD